MADIRINALATTAASTASDDFIAVDGSANGTRKLNAYSPTFGGNLTVSGGALTLNNATESYVELKIAGTTKGYLDQLPSTLNVLGMSGVDVDIYAGGNNPANRVAKFAASGIATTLYGNLTVSGSANLTSSSLNSFIYDGTGWVWTSTGTGGGTVKGGIYTAGGLLYLTANSSLATNRFSLNSSGDATVAGNLTVSGTGSNIFNSGGGNFLVGTTTDGGQKLQVAGTAAISSTLTVSGTGTSSFAGPLTQTNTASGVSASFGAATSLNGNGVLEVVGSNGSSRAANQWVVGSNGNSIIYVGSTAGTASSGTAVLSLGAAQISSAIVVNLSSATASTATSTGALVLTGANAGLGVAGAINVGTFYGMVDGVTAPAATAGYAKIYVDTADGDLKVIFGDGTIKTIATDT